MKKFNFKKAVLVSILILTVSFLLIWLGCLLKNYILTELHGDEIKNLNFYETETVPEYDWIRVISYSESEIEVYFVNKLESYEIGGIATYSCNSKGYWSHKDSVLWSTAGTADTLIWPYWHHIRYYMFY